MFPWHQYLLGALLVIAGANHFRKPKWYEQIMPPYIPQHSTIVMLSGLAEMILGFMLLNPNSQKMAAWGLIVMFLLYLPIHLYMLQNDKASLKLPRWVLIARIPLQFGLMYWAYLYV